MKLLGSGAGAGTPKDNPTMTIHDINKGNVDIPNYACVHHLGPILKGDVTRMFNYVQDQAFRRMRGELLYDTLQDRSVIDLDLTHADREVELMFRQQHGVRVMCVMKSLTPKEAS